MNYFELELEIYKVWFGLQYMEHEIQYGYGTEEEIDAEYAKIARYREMQREITLES